MNLLFLWTLLAGCSDETRVVERSAPEAPEVPETPAAPEAPSPVERLEPSAADVQILLDRVAMSPGVIDGRWGKSTEAAVSWFQRTRGLPATGVVDAQTHRQLAAAAGDPAALTVRYTLTEEDVAGPFAPVPSDPQAAAELDCLCYEDLPEALAERFHATIDLLAGLNPGVDLGATKAGDALVVPNVRGLDRSFLAVARELRAAAEEAPTPPADGAQGVAKLEISGDAHFLHALDAAGNVLYHFPTTVGSSYDPSPSGQHEIIGVAWMPDWHYQPALLSGVPDAKADAVLPPGPNNAVGVVWLDLSKEHYGIHGTSAPETIGYATSSGCVRLTNWDAVFLAQRVRPGVPVVFLEGETARR